MKINVLTDENNIIVSWTDYPFDKKKPTLEIDNPYSIRIGFDKYENGRVITEYLDKYFTFYNEQRIHFSNNGLTPKEKEDEWYKKHPLN